MSMALVDKRLFVCLVRQRSLLEKSRVGSKAHCTAILFAFYISLLLRHDIYHRVRGLGIYFHGMRLLKSDHMPRIFDHCQLHAITKTEIRDFVLTTETDSLYFPFHPARTKPTWDENAIVLRQAFQRLSIMLKCLAIDPL